MLCVDNIQIEGIAEIKHIEKSMIPLFSYGGIFLFRNSNKPASTFRYRLFSFNKIPLFVLVKTI